MFDPNAASEENSGIFGLPCCLEDSKLVFVPVPWDLTTSYGKGTAQGPEAILRASRQVDLYHAELGRIYEAGLCMLPIAKLLSENLNGDVNSQCLFMNDFVYKTSQELLRKNKLIGIVGGDHSVPFGAIQALAEREESFGILHLDAHADTRNAYEGYTWSHASIMRNILEKIPEVSHLVQIGIRDFCEEEFNFAATYKERVKVFTDFEMMHERFSGKSWKEQCEKMIRDLPERVWISFDIDALDPRYCPRTGTPVPGGLNFYEAYYLIASVAKSGRQIIGFDLCEVGDGEWDGNVGARILYYLAGWLFESQC